jgi:fatty-acyl-CoA synthase
MAEATLGLSISPLDRGIRVDEVDLAQLTQDGRAVPAHGASTKRVVSCGAPLPGVSFRIWGPEGILPERRVGEIQVRSPAVMIGYDGESAAQPFADGWLCTGDLGYLAEGELFVVGRSKDIIIAYGQNHAPQDIEWAAERVEGVRSGRVVAFAGSESREGEVLVALETTPHADLASLRRRVRQAVSDVVGIAPRQVLLLAKGAIPKTTSGKVRRGTVRESYERGTLPLLDPADQGSRTKGSDEG